VRSPARRSSAALQAPSVELEQALGTLYFAGYTHRVAISDSRLLEIADGRVRFRYRDRAHGNRSRVASLDGPEFLRRFLLHVLPTGFVRIRYFGFLAFRSRPTKLALCRALLPPPSDAITTAVTTASPATEDSGPPRSPRPCTSCGGPVRRVAEVPPTPQPPARAPPE
jgi:hypothetical protein